MNIFAKFDEIPLKTLQDIKETKRHGHTFVHSDGQRENSIPSHKHSLQGGGYNEPCHEKINILVSDLVRHKPGCTATEDC